MPISIPAEMVGEAFVTELDQLTRDVAELTRLGRERLEAPRVLRNSIRERASTLPHVVDRRCDALCAGSTVAGLDRERREGLELSVGAVRRGRHPADVLGERSRGLPCDASDILGARDELLHALRLLRGTARQLRRGALESTRAVDSSCLVPFACSASARAASDGLLANVVERHA